MAPVSVCHHTGSPRASTFLLPEDRGQAALGPPEDFIWIAPNCKGPTDKKMMIEGPGGEDVNMTLWQTPFHYGHNTVPEAMEDELPARSFNPPCPSFPLQGP